MITVCCVWVRGNVPFTSEYVVRLERMVARHLHEPHRFVCFTDQPESVLGIYSVRIEPLVPGIGWWSKLELFNAHWGLEGRVLYLDLDVLVVEDLGPVVDYADFALVPHAGTFEGRAGKQVIKMYNSSVMTWDTRRRPDVRDIYDEFSQGAARRLWGDQDHIAATKPDEATMPIHWFPRLSEVSHPLPRSARVVLCKRPKNHLAARQLPWFEQAWG